MPAFLVATKPLGYVSETNQLRISVRLQWWLDRIFTIAPPETESRLHSREVYDVWLKHLEERAEGWQVAGRKVATGEPMMLSAREREALRVLFPCFQCTAPDQDNEKLQARVLG